MTISLKYIILFLVTLASPDVVLFDFFLPSALSFFALIILIFLCLPAVRGDFFFMLFLICAFFILLGGVFRVEYAQSFSFLFGDFFFLFVNFIILNSAMKILIGENSFHVSGSPLAIYAFTSFVLCFFYFEPFYEFSDHSGHEMYLFWGGLTSSYYRLGGGSQFVRFSGVFDEPGTFGLFVSLVLSIYFMISKKFSLNWFVIGLTSLSLSYFFWLMSFIFFSFRLRYLFFFLGAFFVIFFTTRHFSEVYLVDLYFDRFLGVFTGETNRSGGNSRAAEFLSTNIFGASEQLYSIRFFDSSGLLVYTAYKGVFVVLGHVFIFIGFFVILFRKFGFYILPLFFSFLIVLFTRNNIFYTSFSLQFFWIVLYFHSSSKGMVEK